VRLAAKVSLVVSVLTASSRGEAACNRPDVELVVPPDGASDVAPNAKLFAHYRSNAEYTGEDVLVTREGLEQVLSGEWNAPETLLSVAPTLEPGERYTVEWPRLRGINSANLGRGKSAEFTVGSALDEAPPLFEGLVGIHWDADRARDDCTDRVEDRFVFDFDLGAASDDGGRESLLVAIFQTKGPNVSSTSPEPVGLRRMPAEGKTVRVTRTMNDGEGDVCFAAVARDLTGKVSASGAREVCVETVAPPFFNGCRAAGARPTGAGLAAVVLGVLALALRRGRR
jgi:hypothetical protein